MTVSRRGKRARTWVRDDTEQRGIGQTVSRRTVFKLGLLGGIGLPLSFVQEGGMHHSISAEGGPGFTAAVK